MSTYIGFSTGNANRPRTTNAPAGSSGGTGSMVYPIIPGKKFRMVDAPLILRDFINALNINKGEKVGQPGYGTDIWSYIFEPNDADTQFRIQTEIQRVASSDPRLILNSVKSFVQQNGILLEVEVAVAPFNDASIVNVFFNNITNQATLNP